MSTIVAISTAVGNSGIGIIRMSGEDSFKIVKKIFKNNKKEVDITPNTINYGHIISGDEIIDEVLVSFFKAPKSFTTENMCEINSHGGAVVMNKILELCLKNGAELAEPRRIYKKSIFKWKNRFIASRSNNRYNKCKIRKRSKSISKAIRAAIYQKD